MRYLAMAMLVGGLGACGGGTESVDLTGVYLVDSQVESSPCGADMPTAMPPMYVKFSQDEILGQKYFALEECTDAAGTDCFGGGLFGGDAFTEKIDGGWRGILSSASSGGSADTMCLLFYSESTALLDGTSLTIESSGYSEEVANTEQLCTADEAEHRNTSMMCESHELLTATLQ